MSTAAWRQLKWRGLNSLSALYPSLYPLYLLHNIHFKNIRFPWRTIYSLSKIRCVSNELNEIVCYVDLFITASPGLPTRIYTHIQRETRGQWSWKHSFPSRAVFKNEWINASALPNTGMGLLYGCLPAPSCLSRSVSRHCSLISVVLAWIWDGDVPRRDAACYWCSVRSPALLQNKQRGENPSILNR